MKLSKKLGLCLRILRERTDNLMAHAERELPRADGDEMQALMNDQIKELILVFGTHGHSGLSSNYAVSVLTRLLCFEPLRPLTGEDDEWNEVGDGVFQNRRCSHVFKQANRFNGQAYDINAVVFCDKDGICWTNGDSFQPIEFPYTPTKVYVDR